MTLDPSTMWLVLFLFLVVWQVYSVFSTRNKVFCSFRRADRTKIEKWAKQNQKRIVFDGGWYHVEPDRCVLMMKWMPLPMWVRCLDFRHDSSRALHPDTFDNAFTPEARKNLDYSDEIRAYEEGGQRAMVAGKQKKGLLDNLFPIIMILGVVVIGYMLYQQGQKLDQIGNGQNLLEQMIGNLKR